MTEAQAHLQTLTLADIRKHNPCYDPATKVPENWSGTVLDILRLTSVYTDDRLWAAHWFISDKTLRLFAVWCARQALALVPKPDPRSVEACDVAERFANGAATTEELAAAGDAAGAAAKAAAWDAAWAAAKAAAKAAARDAAWDAAWAAARAAAKAAAKAAARAAAWDAAWAAARDKQIEHLISMIEDEYDHR